MENAQNLYPNVSFTIAIVFTFTVVHESIKHCDSSKFHYRPAPVTTILSTRVCGDTLYRDIGHYTIMGCIIS